MRRNLVITDSGLGGLNVAALLYEKLNSSPSLLTDIIFVNALPETHHGYNKMPDAETKINMFNRVLYGIKRHFDPLLTGIACNTLSALAGQTSFAREYPNQLVNIIDVAIQYSRLKVFDLTQMHKDSYIIFATETTIDSRIYEEQLKKTGIAEQNIIPVPCPNLASEIESDFQSSMTRQLVEQCVSEALRHLKRKDSTIYVILGCTHYGYIADLFSQTFVNAGIINTRFVNPNLFMVDNIIQRLSGLASDERPQKIGKVGIKIYSRCEILPREIISISRLIEPISSRTAAALKGYELKRDLF